MFHSLYVDLNSFFASVEQQLDPALRGKPVGVLPVLAETTCCIAASVQAKQFGIKTGTPVWEARKRCRQIKFVQARPPVYVEMHHRIVAAVESYYPVAAVLSIDEMALDLTGRHSQEAHAVKLARQIKRAIYDQAGEVMHCSIGIAPNRFLAKTASNFKKPNGLEFIRLQDLPQVLLKLELTNLNGISHGMEKRLNRAGLWARRPRNASRPMKIGVALSDLTEQRCVAQDLFEQDRQGEGLSITLDQINRRFGPNAVHFGAAHQGIGSAPMRIAFNHIPELEVESDG